ncbi:hypothetical protein DCAR_0518875 [Daucus carota subsp. sativus]|uniref:Uncharacterized protein n=1 Tax=Daucus carota subsp. sativus TaxID=79200 RepID=A0A164XJS6_DAUCS|nr:hypothetical protein DCAR_0518875 [Daucus carota subsp. sativus]
MPRRRPQNLPPPAQQTYSSEQITAAIFHQHISTTPEHNSIHRNTRPSHANIRKTISTSIPITKNNTDPPPDNYTKSQPTKTLQKLQFLPFKGTPTNTPAAQFC